MRPAIGSLWLLVSTVSAFQCDCGFLDPLDPTGQLWQSYFETNFTTTSWKQLAKLYRFMQSSVTKNGTARDFEQDNLSIDGSGVHLLVKATTPGNDVPSAGLYTKSTDFGYGSYHFLAQTSSIPGSVQAFYVYKTDGNEVDLEYISKPPDQNQTIKYSVKPQQYDANNAPLNTTLQTYTPGFNTSADLHTYSFVWNSSSVLYAVDDVWSSPITTNVPSLPGVLSMSHWSDGNPRYSGGPPSSDSIVTINRVWVFYNASGSTLACKNSQSPCTVGENVALRFKTPLLGFLMPVLIMFCILP